jgi:hypothetical protein
MSRTRAGDLPLRRLFNLSEPIEEGRRADSNRRPAHYERAVQSPKRGPHLVCALQALANSNRPGPSALTRARNLSPNVLVNSERHGNLGQHTIRRILELAAFTPNKLTGPKKAMCPARRLRREHGAACTAKGATSGDHERYIRRMVR